ncbi:hypothetical protein SKAU_G00309310 [Synaphobranchus kaupii]|uniref:Uncharacterized protein n=1 Tax=Synaphobranchus kaupii TaxID=118154 RepID=A0A9Q1IL35_SYNKA|nr:hypothetical protein SKAU_G00309310 [Synaphobranchus kaupii]
METAGGGAGWDQYLITGPHCTPIDGIQRLDKPCREARAGEDQTSTPQPIICARRGNAVMSLEGRVPLPQPGEMTSTSLVFLMLACPEPNKGMASNSVMNSRGTSAQQNPHSCSCVARKSHKVSAIPDPAPCGRLVGTWLVHGGGLKLLICRMNFL